MSPAPSLVLERTTADTPGPVVGKHSRRRELSACVLLHLRPASGKFRSGVNQHSRAPHQSVSPVASYTCAANRAHIPTRGEHPSAAASELREVSVKRRIRLRGL